MLSHRTTHGHSHTTAAATLPQHCHVGLSAVVQAVLRRRYVQAALAACAAMAVRQNSAVWAAFSLGVRSYTLVKHSI